MHRIRSAFRSPKAWFFALALVAIVGPAVTTVAAGEIVPEKHHLIYDQTDGVWRCLGSSSNCEFGS
jgi:hypothetical protein